MFPYLRDDEAFLNSLPDDVAQPARAVVEQSRVSLEDNLNLALDLHERYEKPNPLGVRILLSPSGYHWTTEDSLKRIVDTARGNNMGIHTHVLETVYQRIYASRTTGQSPVQRLADIGMAGPGVSYAHCVWVTEDDIRILAETGTAVSHNASSNLRLHSGIAPVRALLDAGVTAGVGTDSVGINDDDDLLQEIGLSQRLHRVPGLDNRHVTAGELLHMATLGGAKALTLDDHIGSLEPGKRADIVMLNWDRVSYPYLDSELDVLDVLITRARGRDVRTVLIDGRVVYDNGEYPMLNVPAITMQVQERLRGGPSDEILTRRRAAQALDPHIRAYYRDWHLPDKGAQYALRNAGF